jgi:hypothetical protein
VARRAAVHIRASRAPRRHPVRRPQHRTRTEAIARRIEPGASAQDAPPGGLDCRSPTPFRPVFSRGFKRHPRRPLILGCLRFPWRRGCSARWRRARKLCAHDLWSGACSSAAGTRQARIHPSSWQQGRSFAPRERCSFQPKEAFSLTSKSQTPMATARLRHRDRVGSAKTCTRTIRAVQPVGSKYGEENCRPCVDHPLDRALLRSSPPPRGAPRLVSENRARCVGAGRLGIATLRRPCVREREGQSGSEREEGSLPGAAFLSGARSA